MNDQVIIAVANAITAQAETLKALIDALPKETKVAVEKRVSKDTPATAPKTTQQTTEPVVVAAPAAPVVETTTAPVVVPATNLMPAAPFPNVVQTPAPIPAVQPQVIPPSVSVSTAPVSASHSSGAVFADHKMMMKFVMDSYQAMGPEKGKNIQNVLNSIGVHNINDVKPEHYAALHAGVEALKNG
jgi:hypothetical protein